MSGVREAYSRNLLAMAGIGRSPADTGRTVVDVLKRTPAVADPDAPELFRLLTLRTAEAIEILRTYDYDDEARQAALAVLTGEASCRSC